MSFRTVQVFGTRKLCGTPPSQPGRDVGMGVAKVRSGTACEPAKEVLAPARAGQSPYTSCAGLPGSDAPSTGPSCPAPARHGASHVCLAPPHRQDPLLRSVPVLPPQVDVEAPGAAMGVRHRNPRHWIAGALV